MLCKICVNPHRLPSNHYHHHTSLFQCLHCDLSTPNLSSRCPYLIHSPPSQCATIGRLQIAAAAGMNRWSCGNAGNARKSDRRGLQRGKLMMMLWIILSSSWSLMVDGQMRISPETWVTLETSGTSYGCRPNRPESQFLGDMLCYELIYIYIYIMYIMRVEPNPKRSQKKHSNLIHS